MLELAPIVSFQWFSPKVIQFSFLTAYSMDSERTKVDSSDIESGDFLDPCFTADGSALCSLVQDSEQRCRLLDTVGHDPSIASQIESLVSGERLNGDHIINTVVSQGALDSSAVLPQDALDSFKGESSVHLQRQQIVVALLGNEQVLQFVRDYRKEARGG